MTNSGTASAAVLDFVIPRGETGPTGATGATGPAGLGVPQPTADDAGKIPVVNADGSGYELGNPTPEVDATLSIPGSPADAAAVGEAIEAISPDDESVGSKPWTSKHIVDMLCPPLEATGNPVTCYPVANYPLGVKVAWEPKQEGEGDPSPENIRPITGMDEVTVQQSGKNVLNVTGAFRYAFNYVLPNAALVCGATYTYTCSTEVASGAAVALYVIADNYALTSYLGPGKSASFTVPENADFSQGMWLAGGFANALDGVSVESFMVELGSTPTAYEPYQPGTTATLTLPETIYGGTVDAVTGAGSKTWGYIASYNGEALPGEWISDRDAYSSGATPATGAQVAYKLATPEPIQATGSQSLPALPGTNTIYTDADSVTATGRADPNHTINALNDRIAALEDAATGG